MSASIFHGAAVLSRAASRGGDMIEETNPVPLDQVYPALVDCFGIILLGYIAGKFNFVSETEAKGINTFVGTFSLPALIFGSLCKINIMSVNWWFLLAILIAKAVVFILVLIVTYFVGRRASSKAGLFAIFATQSNDFALGYPILQAVYGHSHPDYPSYLYLLAPVSLVILNPIGFVFLEIGKQEGDESTSKWKTLANVSKGVATNPIIFMTVLGVIGNFVLQGHLPAFADGFLTNLGNAFSASALFLLGLRMVSRNDGNKFTGSKAIVPAILVIVKIIMMPLITREVVSQLKAGGNETETAELSNFGFLYGTFPTAPSVYVFAAKYNVAMDVIAFALVACTFISAPIMFISARLLSITAIDPEDYITELDNFLLDISIISLFACLWVIFVLVISKKWNRVPHSITLALTISQLAGCLGAILWSLLDCDHGWKLYLQYSIFAFGVYASRFNTAILALTLVLIKLRSRCLILRLRPYMIIAGYVCPLVLVLVMLVVVSRETKTHGGKTDPNFQYGVTQVYVALIVLLTAFLTTVVALIITHRKQSTAALLSQHQRNRDDPRRYLLEDETEVDDESDENLISPILEEDEHDVQVEVEEPVSIEDLDTIRPRRTTTGSSPGDASGGCGGGACQTRRGAGRYRCDSEHEEYCTSLLRSYAVPPADEATEDQEIEDEFQLMRHTILLLFLCFSMFVGIALCIWTLVMDKMSGIYVELVFFDGFLNFGQGLFTFAVFGLDAKYILMPIRSWFRRHFYGQDNLVLPQWEDLDEETKLHCQQFLKHHISNCMENLVRDVRYRLKVHKAVFRGRDLVDWLLEADLVGGRGDGVTYGRHLIKGRVIRHIDNYLDFYDDNFLYTFLPQHRANRPPRPRTS